MTPRERWLAAIHQKPLDRLPFWAKLNQTYPARQADRFKAMSMGEIHAYVGSEPPCWLGEALTETYAPGFNLVQETTADGQRITRYVTPQGTLNSRRLYEPVSDSEHPVEFFVKTANDLKTLTRWFQSVTVKLDREKLQQAAATAQSVGESAMSCMGVGESGLMRFIEWLAGPENAHYFLHDHPEECAELFAAMHRVLLDRFKLVLEHHPADTFWFTENTSTTLISVEQYRRYDLPHLREYGQLARAAGRPLVLHMCGHLKLLLPDLATIGAAAFEAFTAPPLGSATLLEGRTSCPQVCLVGGTHASLWLEPAETIIRYLQDRLDELPHHRGLVPSSAGVMPPACPPETIRRVAEFLHGYPLRG